MRMRKILWPVTVSYQPSWKHSHSALSHCTLIDKLWCFLSVCSGRIICRSRSKQTFPLSSISQHYPHRTRYNYLPRVLPSVCLEYRGADKSLARPGRKQSRKHVRDVRDFNHIEMRAAIKFFFFPARQGAEGNLRHSDRNISLFPSWSG